MTFCKFYQVNNLFLHQSYLKSIFPVKLTWYKIQKLIFYCWKNKKIPKVPSSVLARRNCIFGGIFSNLLNFRTESGYNKQMVTLKVSKKIWPKMEKIGEKSFQWENPGETHRIVNAASGIFYFFQYVFLHFWSS